jgi:hypothetical protein
VQLKPKLPIYPQNKLCQNTKPTQSSCAHQNPSLESDAALAISRVALIVLFEEEPKKKQSSTLKKYLVPLTKEAPVMGMG